MTLTTSDAVNKFDWTKATDGKAYPENVKSRDYMKGFDRVSSQTPSDSRVCKISRSVHLLLSRTNGVEKEDVVIGQQITAPNGDVYAVSFVNADNKAREFTLELPLLT